MKIAITLFSDRLSSDMFFLVFGRLKKCPRLENYRANTLFHSKCLGTPKLVGKCIINGIGLFLIVSVPYAIG